MSVLDKLDPTNGTEGVFGVEKQFSLESSGECPRCGGKVEPQQEVDGVLEAECVEEDCEYDETVTDDRLSATNTLSRVKFALQRLTWPYTDLLGVVVVLIGMGLTTIKPLYGVVTGVVAGLWFLYVTGAERICEECGYSHHPDDHFCANCGSESLFSPVDLDAEPLWRRLATPGWFDWQFFSIELTVDAGGQFINKLIDGRRQLWMRVLDVGIVAFAGAYVAVGYLYIETARLAYNFSPDFGGAAGSGGSVPSLSSLLSVVTVELLVDVGTFFAMIVVPAAIGLTLTVIIHELGHGLALQLHGHDVDSYSLSLLFGVIPNYGLTREEIDLDGSTSLRAAWHVDTAGVTFNLLTSGVLLAGIYLYTGDIFPMFEPTLVMMFTNFFALGSVIGAINAAPFAGSDGMWFQSHALEAISRRIEWGKDLRLASYGNTVTTGLLVGLMVLVVI